MIQPSANTVELVLAGNLPKPCGADGRRIQCRGILGIEAAFTMQIMLEAAPGSAPVKKSDGFFAWDRTSSNTDTKAISIIAITADTFAGEAQVALSAGMNAHVARPSGRTCCFTRSTGCMPEIGTVLKSTVFVPFSNKKPSNKKLCRP